MRDMPAMFTVRTLAGMLGLGEDVAQVKRLRRTLVKRGCLDKAPGCDALVWFHILDVQWPELADALRMKWSGKAAEDSAA